MRQHGTRPDVQTQFLGGDKLSIPRYPEAYPRIAGPLYLWIASLIFLGIAR